MAGGYAAESKILDISIDYNKVIQNLFLNIIDTIPHRGYTRKDEKPEDVEVKVEKVD